MGFVTRLKRHPSKNCKQHLSTQEQVELTQIQRINRQQKRIQRIADKTTT